MSRDASVSGGKHDTRARRRVEFWSSVECAAFQRALVVALESRGCATGVRFEISQQAYWGTRSRLARLVLHCRSFLLYPARLAARRANRAAIVCTNPFLAPWVAVRTASARAPVIHWVFDLYPDVLLVAGKVRRGGFRERVIRRLVRDTFDRARVNVFLGERLRQYAEKRFGPIPRAAVIHIGADGSPFRATPPQRRETLGTAARCKILYCGNLGHMHDADTILRVIEAGLPTDIEVQFRGNGAGFGLLARRLGVASKPPRVEMGGNLNAAEWVPAMRAADVALVTMRPGAEDVVMPSKTYSALVAGQAVLAVCPKASDLADLIHGHDAGWVVEPGDVSGLQRLLARLGSTPGEVLAKRLNAWKAGHEYYDQHVLVESWMRLFDSLALP